MNKPTFFLVFKKNILFVLQLFGVIVVKIEQKSLGLVPNTHSSTVQCNNKLQRISSKSFLLNLSSECTGFTCGI